MDCPLLPITVDNLILRAGQKILLDGISLQITQPGITAIMGPNGAGKKPVYPLLAWVKPTR